MTRPLRLTVSLPLACAALLLTAGCHASSTPSAAPSTAPSSEAPTSAAPSPEASSSPSHAAAKGGRPAVTQMLFHVEEKGKDIAIYTFSGLGTELPLKPDRQGNLKHEENKPYNYLLEYNRPDLKLKTLFSWYGSKYASSMDKVEEDMKQIWAGTDHTMTSSPIQVKGGKEARLFTMKYERDGERVVEKRVGVIGVSGYYHALTYNYRENDAKAEAVVNHSLRTLDSWSDYPYRQ